MSKAAALFKEYVWLVDTIYRAGRITLREINDRFAFPDQSAFGQYFKRHTGLSLTEFRKRR